MRWLKNGIFLLIYLFALYAGAMYFFVPENKTFKVENEVPFPIEKVYPQFNNLQNFARWNDYFSANRKIFINYFAPYEGMGSSLAFSGEKSSQSGELYILYANPNRTVKYQFFRGNTENPSLINVAFKPISPQKTHLTWYISTPKQPLLKRILNLSQSENFAGDIEKSITNLGNILGNKVDKEQELASIKYDSIMVKNCAGSLLLGVNVSTSNKAESWYKNIMMNHNKVYSFVTGDLQKREDELGAPVLVTGTSTFKDKEVSYFYGFPVSKRIPVPDNNFIFRTINPSECYIIYYKGSFKGRQNALQKLVNKATKDLMRYDDVQMEFLEPPINEDVTLKILLPVYR